MLKSIISCLAVPIKLDPINNPYAKATTPDQIIAAAIVESFAKDFDSWRARDLERKTLYGTAFREYAPSLRHPEKKIEILFGFRTWPSDSEGDITDYPAYTSADWQSKGTKVNGIEIDLKSARLIANSYETLLNQREALKEKEQKALLTMKRNEEAWNIAERLLGMKRNEFGALVPVQTVE